MKQFLFEIPIHGIHVNILFPAKTETLEGVAKIDKIIEACANEETVPVTPAVVQSKISELCEHVEHHVLYCGKNCPVLYRMP